MNIGGPAVEIATLILTADSPDIEQHLVAGYCQTGEMEHETFEEMLTSGVAERIDSLGRSVRPWDDLKAIIQLARVIRNYEPDVVHTHTAKAGVLGRIAATLCSPRIKLVHTYHGHLLTGYFTKWKTRSWIVAERILAWKTNVLIAVGESVRSDLLKVKIGKPSHFRVIHTGLQKSTTQDRTLARQALRLDSSCIVVAYVGRLTQIKRPDRIIEVIKSISNGNDQVTFLIAGGGEQSEWFNQECKIHDLPIVALGWVDDVSIVYSAADIVLLTSDNEGTPLTLIEAGLAGLPVVSTNVGSVSEIVLNGETGLLTEPSATALSDALQSLIDSPATRTRMGVAAREAITERFSLIKFVDTHLSLYRDLALQK